MKKRGFTLIELLIVVVIMGMLFGLLTIAIRFALEHGKNARQNSDRLTIAGAIQAYRHEYGRWPIDEQSAWAAGVTNVVFTNDNFEVFRYLDHRLPYSGIPKHNNRQVTFLNFAEYKWAGNPTPPITPNTPMLNPWQQPYTITVSLFDDTVAVK